MFIQNLGFTSLDNQINDNSSFLKIYTFIEEIGFGSSTRVFLAKNAQNETVAVKQYFGYDFEMQMRTPPGELIVELANKQREIGQLTNHPNIVRIREVFIENSEAYIVMDYVQGKTLNLFSPFDPPTSIRLIRQILSGIEHLLMRNIIINDFWTGNIMVSDDEHLTLIDLGSNEFIDQDAELPLKHYLGMIENVLTTIGGKSLQTCLDKYREIIPSAAKKETISYIHVNLLLTWINALQREMDSI